MIIEKGLLVMDYDLAGVFKVLSERVEIVYLVDSQEHTYKALKDDETFRNLFGSSGSYPEMMKIFMEHTMDKMVADSKEYSVFINNAAEISGYYSKKTKMRIDDKEVTLNISNYPLDETKSAFIINRISEQDYIQDIYKDEKANIIKSAYLFSMYVDLIADQCLNMNMSEVDDNPVNNLDIAYTQWRSTILNMFHPEDHEMFLSLTAPEYLKENLEAGRSKSFDCEMMNLEGNFIWVKLIFSRTDTGNDDDFKFVFMIEDIHESHIKLMDNLKQFEEKACRDSLTGLYNHGMIEKQISVCLDKCRSENKPVSLIMFDIDHFKRVNDTYGHASGDYVLKTLSALGLSHLKPLGGLLGRWGGEEFLGVFPETDVEKMYETAEALRIKISETEFDTVGHITSSFGVIQISETETSAEAFVRIDEALYRAKTGGRNNVVKG